MDLRYVSHFRIVWTFLDQVLHQDWVLAWPCVMLAMAHHSNSCQYSWSSRLCICRCGGHSHTNGFLTGKIGHQDEGPRLVFFSQNFFSKSKSNLFSYLNNYWNNLIKDILSLTCANCWKNTTHRILSSKIWYPPFSCQKDYSHLDFSSKVSTSQNQSPFPSQKLTKSISAKKYQNKMLKIWVPSLPLTLLVRITC